MELRHLRYFLAVAAELNFSRAAERLRVAQPALSRQIHDLEEQLGFKLFERSTTMVRLTEAGRFFQQQTEKLLVQIDIAVTGAQRIANGTKGDFRIGTGWWGVDELPIVEAARELHGRYPDLLLDFVELPFHEESRAVRDQKIDIGFVSRGRLMPRNDFDYCLIYTGEMKAVLPKTHHLADQSTVRLRDLKEERWITVEETEVPGFKTLLAQLLRPGHFTPKFGRCAHSLRGMLALVGTSDGITMLPQLYLPPEPAGLRYVGTDCAPYEVFAIWSKGHFNAHVPAFLEILRRRIGGEKAIPATLSVALKSVAEKPRTAHSA
jgi:DNA-binding transcriptional LysR family regulator